jgi:hypothetical protein
MLGMFAAGPTLCTCSVFLTRTSPTWAGSQLKRELERIQQPAQYLLSTQQACMHLQSKTEPYLRPPVLQMAPTAAVNKAQLYWLVVLSACDTRERY